MRHRSDGEHPGLPARGPAAWSVKSPAFRAAAGLVVFAGMAAIAAAALVAAALYLFFFVFFPIGRGAIYDPSSRAETEAMARLAEVRPGEKAADLGSGDGRVVCALARMGALAHGYEINPILVLVSRRNIRREGLGGRAFIHWGNFWRRSLSGYSLITVFQVGFVMARLEAKLTQGAGAGVHGSSPTTGGSLVLRPEQTQGNIYRYRIGERSAPAYFPE